MADSIKRIGMKFGLSLMLCFSYNIDAKQQRSYHAIKLFKSENPCPANGNTKGKCPGYVIDHIKPLACNGIDSPNNMQWQTVKEAKAKDKWERLKC